MAQQTVIVMPQAPQPTVVVQDSRPRLRDKPERIAVPAMPMPAAVICCILNFIVPGLGTICAGFSSCCCSRNEDIDRAGRGASILIGWAFGCLQYWTCVICFIGWFWSCAWGVFFIGMSAEYYHNNRIAAGGGYIGRTQNGTIITTTVTNQPTHSQQPISYGAPSQGQGTGYSGQPPYGAPPPGQGTDYSGPPPYGAPLPGQGQEKSGPPPAYTY